ncbi:MAG: ParB family protein [Gammaproteobacteria bacterium]
MSKERPSLEERLQTLQQGFFGKNRELKEADPIEPTPMAVPLERIRPYDRNPRQEPNEAYDHIKLSIASRGFTGSLPITRRPGEPDYMVPEGGNTVLQIVKELYAETADPRFKTIYCLFEPWISESATLIAHLVENDARGELIFIDRARAVHQLRRLLEQETGGPLSALKLATLLREQGYGIDQPTIGRLEYAVEALLPVIPAALRAGMGRPAIDQIRKLEKTLTAFLKHRKCDPALIEAARSGFLNCLNRHDCEDWALDLVHREIEAHVAELCGESLAKVRADFELIEQHGAPGPDAPPPEPLTQPELSEPSRTRVPAPSPAASEEDPSGHGLETLDRLFGSGRDADESLAQEPELEPTGLDLAKTSPLGLPQDVKSLRARMWTLARQLAQRNALGECILACPNKGCGFLVDLPAIPLFAGEGPESAEEARCVTLWWMLAALAEEWPYGLGQAPALPHLEEASIYPAAMAISEGDEETSTQTLVPRVSFPPSLDILARELLAVVEDRSYTLLLQLIDTRRALQAHCRRLGKQRVWEL